MESLTLKQRPAADDTIENWDDDADFQGLEDLNFRHASSTTAGSGHPHRESVSSRMSTRSDRDSTGGFDDDWQVLIPADDENSTADAISSAKSAGIPIPQNVPASALLGGTIKRLGGRRLKKALVDDWGEDIDLPKQQEGGLKLKTRDIRESSDSLQGFSAEFPPSPSPAKPQSHMSFMERLASATKSRSGAATLDKFKDDDEDEFFGDVPTIKIAKNRSPQKPIDFVPPPAKTQKEVESMEGDLDLPDDGKPLRLSLRKDLPKTPASHMTEDLDMDWAEGSLGTRFGGTRRDMRSNPSSSISAFSPSASSCLTAESEDDALDGLILPDSNFKFEEALKKRIDTTLAEPEPSLIPGAIKPPVEAGAPPKDDFFSGIDIGDGDVFDSGKLTLNRNLKHKATRQTSPARRTGITLTFTNKAEQGPSRIPRPSSHDRPRSTLESVSESGPAPQYKRSGSRMGNQLVQSSTFSAIPTPSAISHDTTPSTPSRRPLSSKSSQDTLRGQNTTHPANYLKAKRSMPAMTKNQPSPARQPAYQRPPSRGGDYGGARQALPSRPKTPVDRAGAESSMSNARKPPAPFLPAGTSHAQSHHISIKPGRHTTRPGSSDSNENAPVNRPLSRLSHPHRPMTPTNGRLAPEHLLREAASKRTLTKPTRRRAFGDGNELEIFDDLPTSASSESKFMKQPIARGAPKSVQLRSRLGLGQQSNASSTSVNEQPPSQAPSTLVSPTKQAQVPRFARDTNASRLAREQRIGSVSGALTSTPSLPTVRETGGPLSSISSNFRAPSHLSNKVPSTPRSHVKRRPKGPPQKPHLIKPMGEVHGQAKTEKGMQWNPALFRWEGNENALSPFDIPPPSSSPLGSPSPKSPSNTMKAAPALIANVGARKGVQMSGGMIFDPQRMCWLKAGPTMAKGPRSDSNPMSPEIADDDDDPFAGFEELDDKPKGASQSQTASLRDGASTFGGRSTQEPSKGADFADEVEPLVVGEEFDVGPEFVRRLRVEEERWRIKVDAWVGENVKRDEDWRWAIRGKAMGYAASKGT
ncbi:MAG: hypothetical protein OHK93_007102 [Ramalina farinacea]|uniref:Cytokinesis regulator n=1 Tax=Ramalina farinacea TaxID=258253 RepID=A0AA43TU34_9LECA|nr:hypothetical protein [Ramalina farinacea]